MRWRAGPGTTGHRAPRRTGRRRRARGPSPGRPRDLGALSALARGGGELRELDWALRGSQVVLGRWREEVEQQHRRERVALGKAHFEEVRAIEAAGGRCLPASHGRIGETGRGSGSGGRVVMRRSLRFLGRRVEGPQWLASEERLEQVRKVVGEAAYREQKRIRGKAWQPSTPPPVRVRPRHRGPEREPAEGSSDDPCSRRSPPPLWSRTVPQLHARRWLPRLLAFTTKAPIVRGSRSGLSADPPCPDRDVSGHRGTGWSGHPYAGWRQAPTRGPVHVEAGSATDVGVFPQVLGR